MSKYIIGLLMIVGGFFLIWKTEWLLTFFGRVTWAERYLGSEGGTRIFYKLLGLITIILSFMIMGGQITGILDLIFKR